MTVRGKPARQGDTQCRSDRQYSSYLGASAQARPNGSRRPHLEVHMVILLSVPSRCLGFACGCSCWQRWAHPGEPSSHVPSLPHPPANWRCTKGACRRLARWEGSQWWSGGGRGGLGSNIRRCAGRLMAFRLSNSRGWENLRSSPCPGEADEGGG